MSNTESRLDFIADRFADAMKRVMEDEHLALGFRHVSIAPITVMGGGLPPETITTDYIIPDDRVRDWEQRTGKRFRSRWLDPPDV